MRPPSPWRPDACPRLADLDGTRLGPFPEEPGPLLDAAESGRCRSFSKLAAVEKSTNRFVGWFHFRPAEGATLDEVELGYRLRKAAWGQGYATEGSRALIHKGFTELGVHRVVAETMVVNAASRRVMEKAGLAYVRTFHQPWPYPIEGSEHGDIEYALRKDDWERAENPPV